MGRKVLAFLLAVSMLVSLIPMTAFAEEEIVQEAVEVIQEAAEETPAEEVKEAAFAEEQEALPEEDKEEILIEEQEFEEISNEIDEEIQEEIQEEIPEEIIEEDEEISLLLDEEFLLAGAAPECVYTKTIKLTENGTYGLKLSGKDKGEFTFEKVGNGWSIQNSAGKYLAVDAGKLALSEEPFAWTYKNNAFSVSTKTEQKSGGYWRGWMWIPGWGTKTVTTTYYLSTVTNGAKLSTNCVKAELYTTVYGEHVYGNAVNVDKTNHKYVCKNCGNVKTEGHSYDPDTHKCVCGAYDPAESSVKISVDVKEKTTKKYIGWWPWGYYKNVTTYTATIKTEAKGVKVTKVQYQLNGGRWTTGTCASSDKPIESLKVKAWDNNGKLYEYEWPEKPVPPTPEEVKYMAWEGGKLVEKSTSEYSEVTSTTTTLGAGFYVVKGADVQTGTLTVNGTSENLTTLILCDGAKLAATGTDNDAGISVASNKSLIITGQSGGTGTLIATGGYGSAGIGGGSGGNGGNITIAGGNVTATGGFNAVSIGGGYTATNQGTLNINSKLNVKAGADAGSAVTISKRDFGSSDPRERYMKISANTGYVNAGTDYIERSWDGSKVVETPTTAENAAKVTSDMTSWTDGFYVVSEDVTVSDRITVSGAVSLILADGKTLNAEQGIELSEGNALTVYGQAGDSGALNATGGGYCAGIGGGDSGIGGGDSGNGGTFTVSGGTVTATGGQWGAGIGSGYSGNGGIITVNGGNVTATGGEQSAGIGAGYGGDGGNITINGGTVTATGSSWGAGIGGSLGSYGGDITVNGGTVNATGGESAAGIGSGQNVYGCNVTINGGTVTATGGYKAAGIGGGQDGSGSNVTINGGNITAKGGEEGSGIGRGYNNNKGAVTINDGTIEATGGEKGAGIGTGGFCKSGSDVTINGGNITAKGGTEGAGIGTGGDNIDGMGNRGDNGKVTISGGTVTATGGKFAAGIGTGRNAENVNGTVTISGGTVTATGGEEGAGIGGGSRSYSGTITISGGKVTANAGASAAGVGGGARIDCGGTITISDGTVIATGGSWGAGIGAGSKYDDSGEGGNGGNVTITGGTVTTTGGEEGAGIGGGTGGNGGNVTIAGGTVTATGGEKGAGIGGGTGGDGGNVTITDGTVTTTGGANGAGIGGGYEGIGGNVTIHDGTVTATGGANGAGIGGGMGSGGNVTIHGGIVTATGGANGAGIGGGGSNREGATVIIDGGIVTATGGANSFSIGRGSDMGRHGTLTIEEAMKVLAGDDESSAEPITQREFNIYSSREHYMKISASDQSGRRSSSGGGGSGGGSSGGNLQNKNTGITNSKYPIKAVVTPVITTSDGKYQMMGTTRVGTRMDSLPAGTFPVAGTWGTTSGGYTYQKNNGQNAKNEWIPIMLKTGYVATFFFDESGIMVTGWKQISGKWYYFNCENNDYLGALMLGPGKNIEGYTLLADGSWAGY